MNIITQEAKKRQAVVKCAIKNGKTFASRKYGVSLSSAKRWCDKYKGDWKTLKEKSHRPRHHPNQHTKTEERKIIQEMKSRTGLPAVAKRKAAPFFFIS